jgi:hypothetical protein
MRSSPVALVSARRMRDGDSLQLPWFQHTSCRDRALPTVAQPELAESGPDVSAARLRVHPRILRGWEERFAPLLAEHICRKRKGQAGRRWYLDETYLDETYLKVKGKGFLVPRHRPGRQSMDSMLSATWDMTAAQHFFRSGQSMANVLPAQVTTDGHSCFLELQTGETVSSDSGTCGDR